MNDTIPPSVPARSPESQKAEELYLAEAHKALGRSLPRGFQIAVVDLPDQDDLLVLADWPNRRRADLVSRADLLERKTIRSWVHGLRQSLGLV